jgi:hypothetical protein
MNPNLALLPDWFLNAVIKRVVNKIIIKLRAKDIFDNDLIKKRVESKPEKYNCLKAALTDAGVIL